MLTQEQLLLWRFERKQGVCFLILPAGLVFNPTIPDSKLTKNNLGQV